MPRIDLSQIADKEQLIAMAKQVQNPDRYVIAKTLSETLKRADELKVFVNTREAQRIREHLHYVLEMLRSYNTHEGWKESARDAERRGYDL